MTAARQGPSFHPPGRLAKPPGGTVTWPVRKEGQHAVTQDLKIQEFVMKAIEAEGWAALVVDPSVKQEWLQISQAYYELAETMVRSVTRPAPLERQAPPPASQPALQK